MRRWTRPPFTSRLRRLASRAIDLIAGRRRDADLDEEIAAHLELAAAEHRANGLSAEDARLAAERGFGGVLRSKEQYRTQRGVPFIDTLAQDVKYSVRALRKAPAFSIAATVILGLGIGANATMFSVVNTVLLQPLPFPDSARIVDVRRMTDFGSNNSFDMPDFLALHGQHPGLSAIAILGAGGGSENLSDGGLAEQVDAIHVSPAFFSVFAVAPIVGRTFVEGDDQSSRSLEVVLGQGLWKRRFGADPAVVGKRLVIGRQVYAVVGVVPESLHLFSRADIYLPLPGPSASVDRMNAFRVVGRVASGWTVARAEAQLDVVARRHAEISPLTNMPRGIVLHSLQDDIAGSARTGLELLLAAVALLLLVACANLANLMLARGIARQREIAVMAALGATRGRIIRRLLIESLLIAMSGGALGLLIAWAFVTALPRFSPVNLPQAGGIAVDMQSLMFTAMVVIACGILTGLTPALHLTRGDLTQVLKRSSAGRSSDGGRRLRSALTLSQVALSTALLAGAFLLIQSFWNLTAVNPGFRADHVLTMQTNLAPSRYDTTAGIARYTEAIVERLEELPGVLAASSATTLPSQTQMDFPVRIVGGGAERDGPRSPESDLEPYYRAIDPHYFSAMGIPVRKGRAFETTDTSLSASVAIVNEAFVRRAFPRRNAIGRAVVVGTGVFTDARALVPRVIVGVVGDTREAGLASAPWPMIYLPVGQAPEPIAGMLVASVPQRWVIRTSVEPSEIAAGVRQAVLAVDAAQPAAHMATMETVLAGSISANRFNMIMLGAFAFAALWLAMIGLYGMTSYAVTQRQREIGIRLSLGAAPRRLVRAFISQSFRLALIGVAIGLAIFLAVGRLLHSLLFGVSATDPFVTAAVVLTLIAMMLLATYIAARRAAQVDPLVALRAE